MNSSAYCLEIAMAGMNFSCHCSLFYTRSNTSRGSAPIDLQKIKSCIRSGSSLQFIWSN